MLSRQRLKKITGVLFGLIVAAGIFYLVGAVTFINALSTVTTLIMAALGLTIIFGVMKIANFAHGDFIMLGAYVAWGITSIAGSQESFYFSIPAAFFLVAIVGLLAEFSVLKWFYGKGLIPPMLATWALGIIIHEAVGVVFGRAFKPIAPPITQPINFLGVSYPGYIIFVFGVSALVIVLVLLLYYKTSFGSKSRAAAEDSIMAEAIGINVRNIYRWSIALGAGLAGIAGALLGPLITVFPLMGSTWLVKSFFVVIVGGVGNIFGTLAGGNAMGWPEQLIATLVPSTNFPSLLLAQVVVFVLAGLLILLRPTGLLGGIRERTD